MGLYNFQKRFVPFILKGKKQHTIRAARKRVDQPGDVCHLYTGLRQSGALLLGRFLCTRVEDIEILSRYTVIIAGVRLEPDEREKLAKLDGFKSFDDMADFWMGRLPFKGHIIHWKWTKGDCGFMATHGEFTKGKTK